VKFVWQAAPAGETALRLRIPGWAQDAQVKINAQPDSSEPRPGSYLALTRPWKPGDTVDLELPLPARMIAANPLVESTVNQAAVMRGPIVYCLESPDLPEQVTLQDVRLPRGPAFDVVSLPAPLDRVRGLRCEVSLRPGPSANRTAPLYVPVGEAPARRERVTLIPYFAWNNRGEPHMRVWLPLAD
jgi:hypothetical protein